jgi:hypothetical protein
MNLMPMDRMLKFDLGKLAGGETDALYSHGWALTHYLTFDPERRKLLASYIGDLNSGKPASPAALTAGGGNLDVKLNSYVRRATPPSAAFGYDQLPVGKVDVRKLTLAEAATMPAYILSQRGVSKANAAEATELARNWRHRSRTIPRHRTCWPKRNMISAPLTTHCRRRATSVPRLLPIVRGPPIPSRSTPCCTRAWRKLRR